LRSWLSSSKRWRCSREMSLLQRIVDGSQVTLAEVTASDNRVAASARLWLVVLVATVVVWLIWQHRGHANLEAVGVTGLGLP
ncbi:MAG: hypothetical protein ACRDHK_02895, partial [Actinomycetota bacterium]